MPREAPGEGDKVAWKAPGEGDKVAWEAPGEGDKVAWKAPGEGDKVTNFREVLGQKPGQTTNYKVYWSHPLVLKGRVTK